MDRRDTGTFKSAFQTFDKNTKDPLEAQDQICRKYMVKYGHNKACKDEIKTYVSNYIAKKPQKPFKLTMHDMAALDKGVSELS